MIHTFLYFSHPNLGPIYWALVSNGVAWLKHMNWDVLVVNSIKAIHNQRVKLNSMVLIVVRLGSKLIKVERQTTTHVQFSVRPTIFTNWNDIFSINRHASFHEYVQWTYTGILRKILPLQAKCTAKRYLERHYMVSGSRKYFLFYVQSVQTECVCILRTYSYTFVNTLRRRLMSSNVVLYISI